MIKSYPTGNISRHLATLKVGDKMKVRGPKGAMVYTPNMVRRFGMIAGGTGITPMLQIVQAIRRGRKSGDKTVVDLIFANVDDKDILLREDIDKIAAEDERINVYYVLNNPPEKWDGGVGFVTADMIKVSLPIILPVLFGRCLRVAADECCLLGTPPAPSQGHQDLDLRSAAHGQRHEEGHRVAGLRQGEAREQAGGYGVLLLDGDREAEILDRARERRIEQIGNGFRGSGTALSCSGCGQ